MDPSESDIPRSKFSLKGKTGLIAAAAIVAVLLIGLPAYRVFFAISAALGCAVAGGLYLWNKSHPVEEADVEDEKHPLGLNR
jgi:O-antigen/teichoic acid export membrane protein